MQNSFETLPHRPSSHSAPLNEDFVMDKLLELRGYPPSKKDLFFSESLMELPELLELKGLRRAAERIVTAIDQKQLLAVYGDYDVDGTTSCALLYHFFHSLAVDIKLYQPGRFLEGYGLHESLIQKAVDDGVKVMITVDCGISNIEAADFAKTIGLDLIITDHHQDGKEKTPEAFAVVNPNRRDETCDPDLRSLAGVGVAFALAWAVKKHLEDNGKMSGSLYPLLQFVAIGTIADLAQLNPCNLKLVRHGLKQLSNSQYPGIAQFFDADERKRKVVEAEKISFGIAPLINSKGRLDHPELSLKLLNCDDKEDAKIYHHQLQRCNLERKLIQKEVFEQARSIMIEGLKDENPPCCFVYKKTWHEGVIGIVASKLVETFSRPALVFTDAEEHGVVKASVRTAGTLDIFKVLSKCEHFFQKFGGHTAAAGLSLPKENLSKFRKFLFHQLSLIDEVDRTPKQLWDLELPVSLVSASLFHKLKMLAPFGMGNPRPLFRTKNMQLKSFKILKEQHVKWIFQGALGSDHLLTGITFFYFQKWNVMHPEELLNCSKTKGLSVDYTLQSNFFRGNEMLQLHVSRIAPSQA